ncbi:MAG TPA: AAA family ATPase, partial [Gemmatimonadetes bacterium]|nr:AAA family ATPase [Gemmatimonadota bacterium]
MDIKTFSLVAPNLPAKMAILMRGPTGVGKSHLGKAVADQHSLPFIDVRGSTMSEGDVGGYPDIEGMKESGIMTFCMPSWFVRACNEPVVLMLDELNRSLPGVQQSFFQLVLDRELGNDKNGNPYQLHPDTRVIAAVNHGSEYDVNEMDPALL